MRQLILMWTLMGIFGCQQNEVKFSDSEIQLLKKIEFQKESLIDLKKYVNAAFEQYETSDPGYIITDDGKTQKTGIQKQKGISFKSPENRTEEIVMKFKDKLRQEGYIVFVSNSGFEGPSTISVIKTTDQFDILRFQKTDGINYDIENEDLIKKLSTWNNKYGIEILGADYDWVDFMLKVQPDNIPDFAKEVYEFCPDAVDQGVGDIGELEKIISNSSRLFLWWD